MKTSPVVSESMRRLNHHAVYNGYVEVYPSNYPLGYSFESVPDPYNTLIRYIDDNEMDYILESFHS